MSDDGQRQYEIVEKLITVKPKPTIGLHFLVEYLTWQIMLNKRIRDNRWMQKTGPLFIFLHHFGKRTVVFTLTAGVLYADSSNFKASMCRAIYPQMAATFVSMFKDILQIPRPYWLINFRNTKYEPPFETREETYSTPSNRACVYASIAVVWSW
eukprot:UN06757